MELKFIKCEPDFGSRQVVNVLINGSHHLIEQRRLKFYHVNSLSATRVNKFQLSFPYLLVKLKR